MAASAGDKRQLRGQQRLRDGNIVNAGAGQWGIVTSGGCRQAKFSTPAMTAIGSGGTNGARMVVINQSKDFDGSTAILRTATTSNGTSWWTHKPRRLVPGPRTA